MNIQPFKQALDSALTFLQRGLDRTLPQIWQTEIQNHFQTVFDQIKDALTIRKSEGYVTPLAAAYKGNLLLYMDAQYRFLWRPYSPKPCVKDWFDFRNESFFKVESVTRRKRRLAGQFGLAELVIPCDCGMVLSQAVPKWQRNNKVVCGHCSKVHELRSEDVTRISMPEDDEE